MEVSVLTENKKRRGPEEDSAYSSTEARKKRRKCLCLSFLLAEVRLVFPPFFFPLPFWWSQKSCGENFPTPLFLARASLVFKLC